MFTCVLINLSIVIQTNYFGIVGHNNVSDATSFVMSQIVDAKVGSLYNWEGRGIKSGFHDLENVNKLVYG